MISERNGDPEMVSLRSPDEGMFDGRDWLTHEFGGNVVPRVVWSPIVRATHRQGGNCE